MGYSIKRVDQNQSEVVTLFRRLGASVLILSEVGRGCPDLLIGINLTNYLVEVKDGAKPMSQQKLTLAEGEFFQNWKGQVCIVRNDIDVINLVNRAMGR